MKEQSKYFEFKHRKNLVNDLATLKSAKIADHSSQSSSVTRYVLTRLLTELAISGVGLTPGDRESTMGCSRPLRICIDSNSNDE